MEFEQGNVFPLMTHEHCALYQFLNRQVPEHTRQYPAVQQNGLHCQRQIVPSGVRTSAELSAADRLRPSFAADLYPRAKLSSTV